MRHIIIYITGIFCVLTSFVPAKGAYSPPLREGLGVGLEGQGAGRLRFATNYGFFVHYGTETGLPDAVPTTTLRLRLIAPDDCYTLPAEASLTVTDTEGQTVAEHTYSVGNTGLVIIPADDMKGGDVLISATLTPPASYGSDDYVLAFSDEFSEDGKPAVRRWNRANQENSSAWNRYVSTSEKVLYVRDGDLVARCIPCAPEDREANRSPLNNEYRDWMSGAANTRGKYNFRYGRIDVRALTNPFKGSFPAIWFMPIDGSAGWPYCGEIDLWEMINTSNLAYGTVHAAKESQHSRFTSCNYDGLYHVYTLEWTDEWMKWSIDGKDPYSTYLKSSLSADQLAQGYWPFDKKFYLILNQSVGMGTWADWPVEGHEYETRFDFVRIYQTPAQNKFVLTGIEETPNPLKGGSAETAYDLTGRPFSDKGAREGLHGLVLSPQRKVILP